MPDIKIISFDVDGTLVDPNFNDKVWLYEIPRLYAEKHHLDFEEAKKRVIAEYEKVGENDLRWYDLEYWARFFGFNLTFAKILEKFSGEVIVYADVVPVLDLLQKKHPLIIITAMPREFIAPKMKNLGHYFSKMYSCLTDFKSLKSTDCFGKICREMKIKPEELMHVGDHPEFDCRIPAEIGINTVLIRRTGQNVPDSRIKNVRVIKTLQELEFV